ncbi:ABC transporter ATP-binding protein [Enterococcus cecorum]|uniref:ABC transporter transmembrane domain-containing protein n=1 Tax=Enterococcus cecorum TaxID=44008 RepID=UPI0025A4966D|nr:ABC transporter ATP-binding protein [Enterococcus cecorum]MDM8183771.1 ABC transporter ATP-binding protein [Enterococcus cecorum]
MSKNIISRILLVSSLSLNSIVFLVICMIFTTGLVSLQPIFLGKIIDAISGKTNVNFYFWLLLMSSIFFLNLIFIFLKDWMAAKLAVYSENTIRDKIVSVALDKDVKVGKGKISVSLEEDAKIFSTLIFQHLDLVGDLLSVIITVLLMFFIASKLTVLLLLLFPAQFGILLFFGKNLSRKELLIKLSKERYLKHVMETISGKKDIFVFKKEKWRIKEFSILSKRCSEYKLRYFLIQSFQSGIIQLLFFIYNITLLFLSMHFIKNGELTIGKFISYITYSNSLLSSGISLSEWNSAYQTTKVSLNRLEDFLSFQTRDLISDSGNVVDSITHFSVRNLVYSINDKEVLNNLNLDFNCGTLYLIRSPSGSGKSTLFNILIGMCSPNEGSFLINCDKEVNKLPQQSISYMLQDSYLFSMSILDNLKFYSPDITFEMVKEICTVLEIDYWIESLEEGYNTKISSEYMNFSGGQAQRICLARTLLKKADIYLLDEPLSNLDKLTKEKVFEYLKTLSNDAIVIMNSHDEILLDESVKIIDLIDLSS